MSRCSLGWTAMPVRSGPISSPSPLCVWHLAHWFLKTSLAVGRVALLLGERQQLVDHLLPVGVGQAAALRRAAAAAACRDRLVGVVGQGLLLVERQVGELHLALVDGVEQRAASSRAG